jgi:electron transfer flavoprotein alpha subunit
MARIGVLIEEKGGEFKKTNLGVLSAARQDPASEVYAFVFSDHADALREVLQRYGVGTIVVVKMPGIDPEICPEARAKALSSAIDEFQLDALIGVASIGGKDALARVASLRGAPLVQDCLEVDLASGVVKKSHFSGRTTATIKLYGRPWILSIRPNCLPEAPAENIAEILEYRAPVEDAGRLMIRAVKTGTASGVDLAEAEIIISGGRPIGSAENFSLLRECAAHIGASVGASRAAVDVGFASHAMQIGQTGRTVSPKLYIACGISGSVQHFAGMKTAKIIVAINNDRDAPILGKCDYGLIGDLFEVVPALTKALRSTQE